MSKPHLNTTVCNDFETMAINLQILLVIELFKEQDPDNYFMYRLNGLNDVEIFQIITSESLIDLWDFDCEDIIEEDLDVYSE